MGDHTRNFGVVDSSFCFSSSFSFCPSLSLSLSLHSLSFFFAIFFFFLPPLFSSLLPSLAFYSPLHHFFFIFLFLLFSTLLSYTSLPILSSYFLPYTPLVALSRSPTPTYSQNLFSTPSLALSSSNSSSTYYLLPSLYVSCIIRPFYYLI